MDIDRERVRRVAWLSRLELSEDEVERYAGELSQVLDYVEQIDELVPGGAAPLTEVNRNAPEPREDRPGGEPLTREQALSQAPQSDGVFFLVPPVVEYPE